MGDKCARCDGSGTVISDRRAVVFIRECDRCNGTGRITVRTSYPMSYVCAGDPPDDARGVIGVDCPEYHEKETPHD
jgi:DnaJ-class molecular chaperone